MYVSEPIKAVAKGEWVVINNGFEWIEYQPSRIRDKEFHDVKLRSGEIVECCWPNGVSWYPMVKSKHGHIADYRVTHIRKCVHPMDRDDI